LGHFCIFPPEYLAERHRHNLDPGPVGETLLLIQDVFGDPGQSFEAGERFDLPPLFFAVMDG